MLRRTLLAGALIAMLLPATAACGTPDGAQAEDAGEPPAERAAAREAPVAAGGPPEPPDTVPVRKDAPVPDTARIDPRLREVAASRPDSIVGVLLRLEDPERADTAALRAAGFDPGVTVGRVMTGRIRARDLSSLAAVPGIVSIDAAERIDVPRPPPTEVETDPKPPR